jgi:RNA polymerase sigma factor (sigma-70 family)
MTPDSELLKRFARTNSEDAFAELVKRHVNLVYSAALRQVGGDAHLAQDVAQTVFADLARKAGSLSRRETLTGWLYTSAHFAAAKIARTENRRRDREDKFMREPTNETAPAADWEQLRPALDDAMHELNETDREAILFRYFENQPFIQVGAKLGLNENAARMRVERALEKLRAIFAKRGVTTATALASVISANAVQIAPANLAVTLTAGSVAAAGTGTFTLMKLMTMTNLKLGISTLAVAGVAAAFVLQYQVQEQLRGENASLQQKIAQLQRDTESRTNRLEMPANVPSLTDAQMNELLRLRGEVTRLRQQPAVPSPVMPPKTSNADPVPFQIHTKTRFLTIPTEAMRYLGISWMPDAQGFKTGVLTEPQLKTILATFQQASDVVELAEPEAVSLNGRQTQMRATEIVPVHGANIEIRPTLDLISTFSTNSSLVDLKLIPQICQLIGGSAQPDVQCFVTTNRVALSPGKTVVLEKDLGWLPETTNIPAGPRSLLVFVTPDVVDSAGNLMNFPPPNQ